MDTSWDNDPVKNPLYRQKEAFYTVQLADHRDGVDGIPEPKLPPNEYGKEGKKF